MKKTVIIGLIGNAFAQTETIAKSLEHHPVILVNNHEVKDQMRQKYMNELSGPEPIIIHAPPITKLISFDYKKEKPLPLPKSKYHK